MKQEMVEQDVRRLDRITTWISLLIVIKVTKTADKRIINGRFMKKLTESKQEFKRGLSLEMRTKRFARD